MRFEDADEGRARIKSVCADAGEATVTFRAFGISWLLGEP